MNDMKMNWYKLAQSKKNPDLIKQAESDKVIKDDIKDLKGKIKDLEKDNKKIKDFEERFKKIDKIIEELNLGNRRFFQTQNIFNSLQRKIERMESLEAEWRLYKKELSDEVKKKIEQKVKAQFKA